MTIFSSFVIICIGETHNSSQPSSIRVINSNPVHWGGCLGRSKGSLDEWSGKAARHLGTGRWLRGLGMRMGWGLNMLLVEWKMLLFCKKTHGWWGFMLLGMMRVVGGWGGLVKRSFLEQWEVKIISSVVWTTDCWNKHIAWHFSTNKTGWFVVVLLVLLILFLLPATNTAAAVWDHQTLSLIWSQLRGTNQLQLNRKIWWIWHSFVKCYQCTTLRPSNLIPSQERKVYNLIFQSIHFSEARGDLLNFGGSTTLLPYLMHLASSHVASRWLAWKKNSRRRPWWWLKRHGIRRFLLSFSVVFFFPRYIFLLGEMTYDDMWPMRTCRLYGSSRSWEMWKHRGDGWDLYEVYLICHYMIYLYLFIHVWFMSYIVHFTFWSFYVILDHFDPLICDSIYVFHLGRSNLLVFSVRVFFEDAVKIVRDSQTWSPSDLLDAWWLSIDNQQLLSGFGDEAT